MTAPTVDTPTDEAIAKRIAARAVQSLADSEPDEDTIEAQERLKGTPQESLFVVSAEVLEAFIAVAISNAVYDGELGSPAALLAARREVEATRKALRAIGNICHESGIENDPEAWYAALDKIEAAVVRQDWRYQHEYAVEHKRHATDALTGDLETAMARTESVLSDLGTRGSAGVWLENHSLLAIRHVLVALRAARRENETMRAALTRICNEDGQGEHDPYHECACSYCIARAALAATPEEK